jgi:hypothetical protein
VKHFLAGVLVGIAAFYAWATFQLATPETETTGDGSESWPIFI